MNSTKEHIIDRISFYTFIASFLLLPFFFIPKVPIPLDVSKGYLFAGGVILSFIFWIIGRLVDGKISVPKSLILLSLSSIPVVFLVSSVFSKARMVSFIGTGFEIGTFFSILVMSLALFLASVFFKSRERISSLYVGLFISYIVVGVLTISGLFVDFSKFLPDFFISFFAGNPLGSWNDLAIFAGLLSIISLLSIEILLPKFLAKIFFYFIILLSLFFLALINFTTTWVVLGIFALIVFVYKMTTSSANSAEKVSVHRVFPVTSFAIILICLSFALTGNVFGSYLAKHFNIANSYARPSLSATYDVGRHVLLDRPIVGSGPNRFNQAWNLYKSSGINNTNFWNTQFNSGFGSIPTFMITGGILSIIAWLFFLFVLFSEGIKRTIESTARDRLSLFLLASSFLASVYLWIFAAIYSPSALIIQMAFVITGVFLSVLVGQNIVKTLDISYLGDPRKSFFSILALVILLIFSITSLYSTSVRFIASADLGRAVSGNSLSLDKRIDSATMAANLGKNDLYYRFLSNLMTRKLSEIISTQKLSEDELKKQATGLFSNIENSARLAVSYDKTNYLNWLNLGTIYQQFVPLGVTGAEENAKGAFDQAITLSPSSPNTYFNYGALFYGQKDYTEAITKLEKAISLKADYWDARYVLGLSYYYANRSNDSLSQFKILTQVFPDDKNVSQALANIESGRAPDNNQPTTIQTPAKITPKK